MLAKSQIFKHLLVNCALVVGAILICLGGLELAVRAFHLTPDVFLQADPQTGVWHIPNKRGVYFRKDIPRTIVQINADGLRDHNYPLHKPENTYRIAVLGDSFTQAIHVPLEETYQQRIEHLLNADEAITQTIEVINFGIGGFGTAQEYLVFQHRVRQYAPDMVILAFMLGNDIFENSPKLNGRSYLPYFTLSDDDALTYVPPTSVPLYMQLGTTLKFIPFFYYRLVDGNPLLDRWLRGIRREETEDVGFPLSYHMYAETWDRDWKLAWQITQRLLQQFTVEVMSEGITVFMLALPDHLQVDPGFRDEVLAIYPAMQQHEWEWEKPNRLLRQWCQTAEIPLLDLSPIFKEKIRQRQGPFYYHDDGHWNSQGHRLASEEISKAVRNFLVHREWGTLSWGR